MTPVREITKSCRCCASAVFAILIVTNESRLETAESPLDISTFALPHLHRLKLHLVICDQLRCVGQRDSAVGCSTGRWPPRRGRLHGSCADLLLFRRPADLESVLANPHLRTPKLRSVRCHSRRAHFVGRVATLVLRFVEKSRGRQV